MVLDRRFGELELLRDFGEVQVARGQELQDSQPGFVAEGAVEADDGLRCREARSRCRPRDTRRGANRRPT
jgi:hypothetical protein